MTEDVYTVIVEAEEPTGERRYYKYVTFNGPERVAADEALRAMSGLNCRNVEVFYGTSARFFARRQSLYVASDRP